MPDHIVDANKMVSPWRTLAERLGVLHSGYGICVEPTSWPDGATIHTARMPYSGQECQDLLIGRALRVAWAWAIEHGKTQEFIMAVDMVTQSNPKLLATHCLKLLVAVGYTND